MAYYTDEDRQRAAAKRKLNSQFRQLINSPEDTYDILGVTVPRVSRKPNLSEYGLSDGVEERLRQVDEEYIRSEESKRKTIAFFVTIALIGLFMLLMSQANQTTHPENFEDGRLINNTIAWGGAVLSIGGFFGLISLWGWAFDVKPKETHEHVQYKKYKEQLSYYEYW